MERPAFDAPPPIWQPPPPLAEAPFPVDAGLLPPDPCGSCTVLSEPFATLLPESGAASAEASLPASFGTPASSQRMQPASLPISAP